MVDFDRETARATQVMTGARLRTARVISTTLGPARVPMPVAIRAYSRIHDELVRTVASEPVDFVYGGTTGALAAVAESATRLRVPYGIDFEDLHSAEYGPGTHVTNVLASRIERQVIEGAAFATAGSPMIADAYERAYRVRPLAIHNTFSMTPAQPRQRQDGPLRLYWFSQTLGPARGLEDIISGAGKTGVAAELHLRARAIPSYLTQLLAFQRAVAPRLTIVTYDPSAPDDMVRLAQPYDAGLACDEPLGLSRQFCLANKLFTYLAAGIPVILSRTPAHARLEPALADAAFGYDCGDEDGVAEILTRLSSDAALRERARCAARSVAERRWHWEHPEDRGALLAAIAGAIR
jgi:glycosyltransferase involved in cell wall biosynthesis